MADRAGRWQRRTRPAWLGKVAKLPGNRCGPILPPFQGGWAGLFGYELARGLERVPPRRSTSFSMPALAVGLYDVVVAFDHRENRLAHFAGLSRNRSSGAARTSRRAAGAVSSSYLASQSDERRTSAPNRSCRCQSSELAPQFAVAGRERPDEQFLRRRLIAGPCSGPSSTSTPATCSR